MTQEESLLVQIHDEIQAMVNEKYQALDDLLSAPTPGLDDLRLRKGKSQDLWGQLGGLQFATALLRQHMSLEALRMLHMPGDPK